MRPIPAGFFLICTHAMMAGCSAGTAPAKGQDLVPDLGVNVDVPPVVCEPDWLKWVSPHVYTEAGPSKFTRPFFTMCEEGMIRWDGWEVYDDDEEESLEFLERAQVIACPGGQCKWGLCKEDADYFESLAATMGDPVKVTLKMRSQYCDTCNINNVMFAQYPDVYGVEYWCDSGPACCDSPLDDPCPTNKQWGWSVSLRENVEPPSYAFLFSAEEYDYSGDDESCLGSEEAQCGPRNNAFCVPGTASLYASDWDSDDLYLADAHVAGLVANGVDFDADYAQLIIADTVSSHTVDGQWTLPECDPTVGRTQHGSPYFSCSGAAVLHTKDGKWVRAVWLYKYDRNECSKPCWMATEDEGLEVELYVQELPGKPEL